MSQTGRLRAFSQGGADYCLKKNNSEKKKGKKKEKKGKDEKEEESGDDIGHTSSEPVLVGEVGSEPLLEKVPVTSGTSTTRKKSKKERKMVSDHGSYSLQVKKDPEGLEMVNLSLEGGGRRKQSRSRPFSLMDSKEKGKVGAFDEGNDSDPFEVPVGKRSRKGTIRSKDGGSSSLPPTPLHETDNEEDPPTSPPPKFLVTNANGGGGKVPLLTGLPHLAGGAGLPSSKGMFSLKLGKMSDPGGSPAQGKVMQTSRKSRAEIMAMLDLWGDDHSGLGANTAFGDESEVQSYGLVSSRPQWHVEHVNPGVRMPATVSLGIDEDEDEEYYSKKMRNEPHTHYVSMDTDRPLIISIQKKSDNESNLLRAVTRLPVGLKRSMINPSSKEKERLRRAGAPDDLRFRQIKPQFFEKVSDELQKLEQRDLKFRTHHTVGVLYRKKGQTLDNEMYNNQGPVPELEEFLEFLGERIQQNGWEGFRGGLDVRNGSTGEDSFFTSYQDKYQLMFHVSTLLPYTPGDEQQVERKRHIGNDLVVIVFQEGPEPFDPASVVSNMNHTYIVIRKVPRPQNYDDLVPVLSSSSPSCSSSGSSSSPPSDPEPPLASSSGESDTYYELAVTTRQGVPPFGPFLHDPPIFRKDAYFRNYFLTKVVSACRATLEAPAFEQRLAKAYTELLKLFIQEV